MTLLTMTFKQEATAAIEAMKLPRKPGRWLEFDLLDQHNQTLRDVLARIAEIPEEPTIDKILEEIIDPMGEEREVRLYFVEWDEMINTHYGAYALRARDLSYEVQNSQNSLSEAVRKLHAKIFHSGQWQ